MTEWARRVLIVEDEAMVSALLTSVLTSHGFTVASCSDAASARTRVVEFDPDLVILDVNLGTGPTGVQLGYVLSQLHPDVALLYLTRYPAALLADGAMADHVTQHLVISKDDVTDDAVLVRSIEDAMRGQTSGADIGGGQLGALSRTQLRILRLVAEGLTNSAIAEQRQTTEGAVEKQLKLIYSALGLVAGPEQNARVLAALKYVEAMGSARPVEHANTAQPA